MIVTTAAYDATITADGEIVPIRVTRDSSGELHLGTPDAVSVVEELLVYDLGDDLDEGVSLADELRAIGTGRAPARTRAWNLVRVDIGPAETSLRLQLDGAGAPMVVTTRELHDVVSRFVAFLRDTEPAA